LLDVRRFRAGTLTNLWYFLTDSRGNVLGKTGDNGSTGFGSSPFTTRLNLASPYTVPTDGLYYVRMVQVGTVATVKGVTNDSGIATLAPQLTFLDSSHTGVLSASRPASNPDGVSIKYVVTASTRLPS
jgi:hypothetical protein